MGLTFWFLSDKKLVPKTANDIKLINAGKILENNKTVGQCRTPLGELPKGTITMHVVVQPPITTAKTGNSVYSFCLWSSACISTWGYSEYLMSHLQIKDLRWFCVFIVPMVLFVFLYREESGWSPEEKSLRMYHIVRELLLILGQAFPTLGFAGRVLPMELICWKHNNLYNGGHSCLTVRDGDHVFAFYKMGVRCIW